MMTLVYCPNHPSTILCLQSLSKTIARFPWNPEFGEFTISILTAKCVILPSPGSSHANIGSSGSVPKTEFRIPQCAQISRRLGLQRGLALD